MSEILAAKQVKDIYGYSKDTLKQYEEAGRIVPLRTPGGQRRYLREDVE